MEDTQKNTSKPIESPSNTERQIRELKQLVTKLKNTEEALRKSEEKYRFIVEHMADTVWVANMDLRPAYVSSNSLKVLGFTPEERLNQHLSEMVTPETYSRLIDVLAQEMGKDKCNNVDPDRVVTLEMEYYHKNGHTTWLENRIHAIRDKDGKIIGIHGVSRDITERKRMEDALKKSEKRYRELSTVDNLTQLYNLRQFYAQLKVETDRSNRYGHPLTLLFLDLDDFKAFNDTYGHIEGDKVLQRIGRIIKDCLRETDFAYRYGGEEFTIILPMTTEAEGSITAERINAKIRTTPFSPPPDRDVYVTVSTGVAQYRPKECIRSFVNRADQLMYEGKKRGKNRVFRESISLMTKVETANAPASQGETSKNLLGKGSMSQFL